MKYKTQQSFDVIVVQKPSTARPPLRSSFLGNFLQKSSQQSCRLCKANSDLIVSTAARALIREEQLSRCQCTSTCGKLVSNQDSHRRRSQHICSAAPPSSSELTSKRADASATDGLGSSTRPLSDGKGAESTSATNGNGTLHYAEVLDSTEAQSQLVRAPEDYVLESGELSYIDRGSNAHPADTFRCTSCSEAACQVCTEAPLEFEVSWQG